jgi:hypothetical protein
VDLVSIGLTGFDFGVLEVRIASAAPSWHRRCHLTALCIYFMCTEFLTYIPLRYLILFFGERYYTHYATEFCWVNGFSTITANFAIRYQQRHPVMNLMMA